MKIKRKIIEIDEELCNGCGDCVTACAEGAIQMVEGKAKVISDVFCDGLGACIGECPTDALKIVEREAEPFDEEAVKQHLSKQNQSIEMPLPQLQGCPSSRLQSFGPSSPCEQANQPRESVSGKSALSQWPIQIHLIPPSAPFLNNADLLIAADCVPAACPDFHENYLKGKKLMLGCPKLDDVQSYIAKFTEIFKTATVKSITIMVMEVPCCSGLPAIINQAMELAGRKVPVEKIMISIQDGKVLEQTKN